VLVCWFSFQQWSKMILGVTYGCDQNRKQHQNKTVAYERFTGTWISYRLNKMFFRYWLYRKSLRPDAIAITRALDPRSEYSPTWSIQNIQFTFNKLKNLELYAGVKTYWTGHQTRKSFYHKSQRPFWQKCSIWFRRKCTNDTRQPLCFNFWPWICLRT
jgi:outer membrane receptor for ferrienterochelin and colicins